MRERYTPHRAEDVLRANRALYENVWNGYAEARRALYPYEVPPWEEREAFNIWEDMASRLNPVEATKIIDLGTNDGYLHSVLRHKGFAGHFVGVDIHGEQLPAVEYFAQWRWPRTDSNFMEGDASNLRELIPDSSTPNTVAAFLAYHMDKKYRLFEEAHRITEPGGTVIFATRGVRNQLDTWQSARDIAHSQNFAFPREIDRKYKTVNKKTPIEEISVYSNFTIDSMHVLLEKSKKFKVVHRLIQDGPLWIPADEKGFFDYARAVESLLPYTENVDSGLPPTEEDLLKFRKLLFGPVWGQFERNAKHFTREYKRETGQSLPAPYHLCYVSQAYFVTKVIK